MSENKYDFEKYFNEGEMERALDEFLPSIAKKIVEEDRGGISVTNPSQLLKINTAYNTLKYIFNNSPVQIEYELNTPLLSMGSITITGKDIGITNKTLFVKVCRLASNIDIYPRTDGKVSINLTFHGLTNKI